MVSLLAGFNGERPDPVTGYSHLGNGYRACQPGLRRFNVPDGWSPFGAGGINPYACCVDDPVNQADPSGHMSVGQWIGMGLGIVAGIALSLVTEGAALPAVTTLFATVAGNAAVGAGVELVSQALDGKGINWGQVGIAMGISTAAALGGYGLGRLIRLKGAGIRSFWASRVGGNVGSGGASESLHEAVTSPEAALLRGRPEPEPLPPLGAEDLPLADSRPQSLRALTMRTITGHEAVMRQAETLLPDTLKNEARFQYLLTKMLTQAGRARDGRMDLYRVAWNFLGRSNPPAALRNAFIETERDVYGGGLSRAPNMLIPHADDNYLINAISRERVGPFMITRSELQTMQDIGDILGQGA